MAFPRIDGLRALELGGRGTALQRELNALVLAGAKTATAGHVAADYATQDEAVETVGEEQYLLDADGSPIARVRFVRVDVVPFDDVTWEFAQAEGEDFVDIDDWRTAHRRYWQRECGVEVTGLDLIACLWFEVVEVLA